MAREEAFRELEELYADLGRELDARNPKCDLSGRCCRFRDFGHQLWTTDLELDYLVSRSGPPSRDGDGACPYLENGRCGVRGDRMLGCRVYFCDPGFRDEMGLLYERYHRRVKEIHARHGIPYAYGELLAKLRAADLIPSPSPPRSPNGDGRAPASSGSAC